MLIQVNNGESIQNIIDSIQHHQVVIYLKNGIYREKILIDKPNITLVGEEKGKVILVWSDASGTLMREDSTKTYGTSGSATVTLTSNAKGFKAENIVFKNDFDYPKSFLKDKQAVALKNDADKSLFIGCEFLGYQDTLYANKGRQYYKDSYIEGNVDFIFGGAQAYFENCNIFSKKRDEGVGYVMAPSTLYNQEIGYIFNNCKFDSDGESNTIFIGRPWHPGKRAGYNPSAIVMNSYLGSHIKEEGWDSMSGFSPDDARFYEYNNYGEGSIVNIKRRVLLKEEMKSYSKEKLFENWNI